MNEFLVCYYSTIVGVYFVLTHTETCPARTCSPPAAARRRSPSRTFSSAPRWVQPRETPPTSAVTSVRPRSVYPPGPERVVVLDPQGRFRHFATPSRAPL